MRLIIGIVVFIPFAVLLGGFAAKNRQMLTLEFWPLANRIETSASVWILLFLGIGILVGLGMGWLSTMAWRRRAWKAERINRTLERKLDERADLPPPSPQPASGGASPAPSSSPANAPARTTMIDN